MDTEEDVISKLMARYTFKVCTNLEKYTVEMKIGQGTFGEVYKGYENRKNNNESVHYVALKKIKFNKYMGLHVGTLREIHILSELKHENIVNFLEIFLADDENCCLVFDFYEYDLAGLIANAKQGFSAVDIKRISQQILNGLFFIHANMIIHRDLKPANIMISKTGIIKIGDFGLARNFTDSILQRNYTNEVVTLWYRAPELLLGDRSYGPAVDMWGAGCIIVEMCILCPLLPSNSEKQQLEMITNLCGSISPANWPDVVDLPLYPQLKLPQGIPRRVHELLQPRIRYKYVGELVDRLLELDPSRRYTANKALLHRFFWTPPPPSDLSELLASQKPNLFELFVPHRVIPNMIWQEQQILPKVQENNTSEDMEF